MGFDFLLVQPQAFIDKEEAASEPLHLASNACVYTNLTNREISDLSYPS